MNDLIVIRNNKTAYFLKQNISELNTISITTTSYARAFQCYICAFICLHSILEPTFALVSQSKSVLLHFDITTLAHPTKYDMFLLILLVVESFTLK